MQTLVIYFFGIILATSPAYAGEPKVLILGDSLTEGLGVEVQQSFPSLLQNRLRSRKGDEDLEVINGGVSGSTSASAVSRLKWHLKARLKIVIIALGANDGLRGIPVTETSKNIEHAIELAQKNGVKVLLAGMKLPLNYGPVYRKEFEKMFEQLSRRHKDILFVPYLLKGVGGESDLNQSDGIHPNAQGHQKIAELLYPFIAKLL